MTYFNGLGRRTLDGLKFAAVSFVFAFIAAISTLADTAILVALPSEQSALSREVRIIGQSVELAQHRVSIGYHKGEKLYIVRTGAGNLNSAMITQALLTRYRINRVISIGVAGYIGDNGSGTTEILPFDSAQGKLAQDDGAKSRAVPVRIGDIFIATEVVNHQEGKETTGGFEVKEKLASTQSRSEGYENKCAELRSNAVEVAEAIVGQARRLPTSENGGKRDARPTNVHEGRLVSGDSFIASSAKRKWLHDTFHADAVDMVSAGIARVCEANGVPYVIIRALSDNADESASAAFASFVQNSKEPVTVPIALALVEQLAAVSPVTAPIPPPR